MNRFDISPFFRSTVGFDRLFDQLGRNWESDNQWPQYDVVRTAEDAYQISIALPGYHNEDIHLETREGLLTVRGERKTDDETREYLHRGINQPRFSRTFQLAEHVEVQGARLTEGILTISLQREILESLQPRKIEVTTGKAEPRMIESDAA